MASMWVFSLVFLTNPLTTINIQHYIMKRYTVLSISLFSFFVLLLSSCRKDIANVEDAQSYVGDSFSDVFESYWNGMNNNYVFWSIDTTNWDAMYTRYKPLFSGLDINKTADQQKAASYFRAMSSGLIDSHYNLSFTSSTNVADSSVDPAYDRKVKAGLLHTHYVFYDYDAENYLDEGYVSGKDTINTLDGSPTEAIAGTINGKILYLGFNQFNLKASYEANDKNGVKKVLQYFLGILRNPPTGFKGVVIDVRGNGGGSVYDLNFLVGNLIGSKVTIGATRYKNGNGRLDYTPWVDAVITPQSGSTAVTVPIVAIADVWSVSLAEITAMAIHSLPTGHVVGETTWGANGPLADNQEFNAGQFTAAGFVSVYTSSSIFRYKDGNIYEGKGFPPDYPVPFKLSDFQTQGDKQLEQALQLMQ